MEKFILTVGGLFHALSWGDLFFFIVTLLLLLLLIYIIYLIKDDDDDIMVIKREDLSKNKDNQKVPEKDKPLTKIVDELEMDYKPKPIDMSDYEKELENTAIISYDELINRTSTNIYYDDDYDSGLDDVLVQKIDDNKMSSTQELVDLPRAVMMSYESEEAFLSALKVLQKNLVR